MSAAIKIVLLMPSDLVRHAIALLLQQASGMDVVADSWSAAMGIRLVDRHAADLVIVDAAFPNLWSVVALLKRSSPHARVLVLARSPSQQLSKHEWAAGADGYAFESYSADDFEATIRRVITGGR